MASFGGFDNAASSVGGASAAAGDDDDRAHLLGAAGLPAMGRRGRRRRGAPSALASSLGGRRASTAEGVDDILRRSTISFPSGRGNNSSRMVPIMDNPDQISVHPNQQPQGGPPVNAGQNPAVPGDDLGLTGCAGSFFCHPKRTGHKIVGVILMCLLGFGSYFCFDNPGALQNEIKNDMGVSTFSFSTLYSWYSVPNVFLPLMGGFLMDTLFGLRLGTILWATFIVIGQTVTAYGAFVGKFTAMQTGRFIFGVGGESLAVAQNTYTVLWFKGKGLNMIFGLQVRSY